MADGNAGTMEGLALALGFTPDPQRGRDTFTGATVYGQRMMLTVEDYGVVLLVQKSDGVRSAALIETAEDLVDVVEGINIRRN